MKAVVMAVVLGGAFGSATASVESLQTNVMLLEIEVEVLVPGESVVAHLTFEDDPVLTLPLLDRGNGRFGIQTELEPKNYFVVFEVVGADGGASEPVSLTQLGADLLPDSGATPTSIQEDGLSPDSQRMLWLAVALAAASLSVLAFWVLGGRDARSEGDDEDEE